MSYLNLPFAPDQHDAVFLGLLLPFVFLIYPTRKWGRMGHVLDGLFILMSALPSLFVIFFYDTYQEHAWGEPQVIDMVLFVLLSIALFEGLRRALGLILPLVMLIFMIYPLFNNYLPGILSGRGYSFSRITLAFYLPDSGVYHLPLDIASTTITAFMIFGAFLVTSGAGDFILNLSLSLLGRVRGAGAKASIFASGIFGTLNSSSAANVATTGTFTIPMMKKTGYRPVFAAGVEACASNGGHLSPPVMGTVAFIMAEFLQMPYATLTLHCFIPALLYYVCMFMQVDFEAARHDLKGLPASELPSLKATLKEGWIYSLPVLILIYLLFIKRMSPGLAALWSALSILVVTAFSSKTRFTMTRILEAVWETRKGLVAVGLSTASAGIVMASLELTSLGLVISTAMVKLAGGNLFLLLVLAAITCFIFGMGMTSVPCYIFVVIMVAPALLDMGIPPIASHLFIVYAAFASFITPPVCMTSYVAAGIAGTNPMTTGYWATRIGIGIFIIPFAWIYNPELLLMGSPTKIVFTTIVCLIGVAGIASGLEGYLLRRTSWWHRLLFAAGGFMMFFPNLIFRLTALAILVVLAMQQIMLVKAENRMMLAGGVQTT